MTHPYVFATLLLLTPALAAAQQPPPREDPPVVTATGEGIVQAVPDRAWVHISAESRAGNPREAQKRNADAMNPVIEKLKAAGIPADAIRTIGYELQQEWDYVNNRRVSRGFVARNTIEVRVDTLDRLGEYLEIAVGSGATSVGDIRFDLKDRAKLERDALRMAAQDARMRAEAMAAGAGRTLDRVIRIDEQGSFRPPRPPMMMTREAAAQVGDAANAPPISAGQMEIQSRVTLTAVLK